MERRALVLALALTLPLLLYGIPYAYAVSTQSTYVSTIQKTVDAHTQAQFTVKCSSSSDFTQHYAIWQEMGDFGVPGPPPTILEASLINSNGDPIVTNSGQNPNGWFVAIVNNEVSFNLFNVQIICQSPITSVAGIGVPEFGSLYVAIALGALIYFALSRQYAGKRPAQATTRA